MKTLNQDEFNELVKHAPIKPRLKTELRFLASIHGMSPDDWEDTELIAITDRTGSGGVLLIAPDKEIFITAFELSRGITSNTGRAQAIICDFCKTWQSGTRSGSITFPKNTGPRNTIGFLCCADLHCSSHVRDQTDAAKTSRAHLHEDLSPEQRIERLKDKLRGLIETLRPTEN